MGYDVNDLIFCTKEAIHNQKPKINTGRDHTIYNAVWEHIVDNVTHTAAKYCINSACDGYSLRRDACDCDHRDGPLKELRPRLAYDAILYNYLNDARSHGAWPVHTDHIDNLISFCLFCYRPMIGVLKIMSGRNEHDYYGQEFCSIKCLRSAGDCYLEKGKTYYFGYLADNMDKLKHNHKVYDKYESTFYENEALLAKLFGLVENLYNEKDRIGDYYPTKIIPGVYFLYKNYIRTEFAAEHKLIRVGRSDNIANRLNSYVQEKKIDFDSFGWIRMAQYEGQAEVEDFLIKYHQPIENKNQKNE